MTCVAETGSQREDFAKTASLIWSSLNDFASETLPPSGEQGSQHYNGWTIIGNADSQLQCTPATRSRHAQEIRTKASITLFLALPLPQEIRTKASVYVAGLVPLRLIVTRRVHVH